MRGAGSDLREAHLVTATQEGRDGVQAEGGGEDRKEEGQPDTALLVRNYKASSVVLSGYLEDS